MRAVYIGGFVLMVIAQWYAPLSMIRKNEATLELGKEFRFKTQPVDPSDPFRGKYVTLNFEAERVTLQDTTMLFESGEQLYAVLATDSAGFSYVDRLMRDQPEFDDHFFTVKYEYEIRTELVWVEFPFERYYVEESKASEAERLYWENNRNDSTMNCYAVVRVHLGNASLVDVMINDRPILDVVREMNSKSE